MDNQTQNLLRAIALASPSMSPAERQALIELADKGYTNPFVVLSEPHLLTADQSAAWLGISPDSFARARKEFPADLAPNEIYPGHKRWCKIQLLEFSNRHVRKPIHPVSEQSNDGPMLSP